MPFPAHVKSRCQDSTRPLQPFYQHPQYASLGADGKILQILLIIHISLVIVPFVVSCIVALTRVVSTPHLIIAPLPLAPRVLGDLDGGDLTN